MAGVKRVRVMVVVILLLLLLLGLGGSWEWFVGTPSLSHLQENGAAGSSISIPPTSQSQAKGQTQGQGQGGNSAFSFDFFNILGTTPRKPKFQVPTKAIMSKMTNETLRAQLGRNTWYLLHTMSTKFPLSPSPSEQQAFLDFISLFSQLYPCGECAAHFQGVLARLPPKVGSRSEVIEWTCDVHNVVNERLNKPLFNCTLVEQQYQCGCGEE